MKGKTSRGRTYDRTKDKHIGEVYSRLTIIDVEYDMSSGRQRVYAACKCECGKDCRKRLDGLISKKTVACSAKCTREYNNTLMFKGRSNSWAGCGELYGTTLVEIRRNARRRGIFFDEESLTVDFLWNLFLQQDNKCAYTGLELTFGEHHRDYSRTASLDRIDSEKGYEVGNIQWVHKCINRMKIDVEPEMFIKMCKLVAQNYS